VKYIIHYLQRRALVAAGMLAILGVGASVRANIINKANNSNPLNLPASWTGAVVPTSGDIARWGNGVLASYTLSLGADTNWAGIQIANPLGDQTIIFGNPYTLTLGSSGIDMSTATRNFKLYCPVVLGASQVWSVNSGVTLTIGTSGSGGISGSFGLTKTGAGTLLLNAPCTYTGDTIVSGGTLQLGMDSPLPFGTGKGNIQIDGIFDLNAKTNAVNVLSGSGVITNSVASTNTTFIVNESAPSSFSGAIRSTTTSRVLLVKAGAATLTLSGTNDNASCGVIVSNGAVLLAKTSTASVHAVGGGGLAIYGGTAQLGGSGGDQIVDTAFVTNNAAFDLNGQSEAIGGLIGNGVVTNTSGSPATLTITNGGADSAFSGTLRDGSGTLALTKVGTTTFTLNGPASAYTGGTTVNGGKLILNTIIANGGLLTTASGTTLAGTGTNTGPVNVTGTLNPGDLGVAGTFGSGSLTFGSGGTVTFDLSTTTTAGTGVNDLVQVNGDLTGNNNAIAINPLQGTLQSGGTYRLINYSGSLPNGAGTFAAVPPLGRYSLTLDYGTANQVNLQVAGGPANLKWAATTNSAWDVSTTNWVNLGTSAPDRFYAQDTVLFDDSVTGVTNNVTIGGTVTPTLMTNKSSVNNFTFSGSGKISGGASIVKDGTSTLTLSTANDFTGPVTILAGILAAGTGSALGATNGPTIITNSATLDVAGQNLGLEPVTVSGGGVGGTGAIINSGVDQVNALRSVTMAGNTTFGGAGRWDIRAANLGATNEPGTFLSTGGQSYKLTKVGTNQVSLVSAAVDSKLGDIDIQGGSLSFQLNTTTMGNPANTVTVQPNGTLGLYHGSFPFNKVFVLNGDGATIYNENNVNVMQGNVTLIGSNVFNIAGTSLSVSNSIISGAGSLNKIGGSALILAGTNTYTGNTVVNDGRLALVGATALSTSPNISLIAPTARLDVSGRTNSTLTLVGSQILQGNGTVWGNLVVGQGTTVSPGISGVGALTVTNAVTIQGTASMDLAAGTNDVINGAASIIYGGTLSLSFTPGSLTAGTSYKLFSATTYSGSFASITPSIPGTGLLWDTSSLTNNGTLKVITPVVARPGITTFALSGANVILKGTNGPLNGTYYVLNSTNVALPLANWTRLSTNQFDSSGNFNSTTAINPSLAKQFFTLGLQ
jgi:fibronectin-binding autotransporter adhesin